MSHIGWQDRVGRTSKAMSIDEIAARSKMSNVPVTALAIHSQRRPEFPHLPRHHSEDLCRK